jgi:hypothetical protein
LSSEWSVKTKENTHHKGHRGYNALNCLKYNRNEISSLCSTFVSFVDSVVILGFGDWDLGFANLPTVQLTNSLTVIFESL